MKNHSNLVLMENLIQWGNPPSKHKCMKTQNYECKGIDGKGCFNESSDEWLSVVNSEGFMRALCRSCFGKFKKESTVKKIKETIRFKKSQMEIFSENPRHMSKTNEHYTPPYIVEAARSSLIEIDLDPASSHEVNKWSVKAKKFFDKNSNGFNQNWNGNVFLNPPGGNCDILGNTVHRISKSWSCETEKKCNHTHLDVSSSQKKWWKKLYNEWKIKNVDSAIFIGFSVEILQTTQVNYLENTLLPLDFPMCFPSRRIAYFNKAESIDDSVGFIESDAPPHSSVIIFLPKKNNLDFSVYDESIDLFVKNFSSIGKIVIPRNW